MCLKISYFNYYNMAEKHFHNQGIRKTVTSARIYLLLAFICLINVLESTTKQYHCILHLLTRQDVDVSVFELVTVKFRGLCNVLWTEGL